MNDRDTGTLCVVAILRGELPFVHEWLAYHRILGVDHFILYDDDPSLPLKACLEPHGACVTIVDWHGTSSPLPGRNRQTKAYLDALPRMSSRYEWVSYLDGDEFIALRKHSSVQALLADFTDAEAVSLNWHCFGNNGHFRDPSDLVISSLTRRANRPSPRHKSITRVNAIADIQSAHSCVLRPGSRWVDANGRPYSDDIYPGKTDVAHVNHYMCRSFLRWMDRPRRGDVGYDERTGMSMGDENRWKLSRAGCLRAYLSRVLIDKHRRVDLEMLPFRELVQDYLRAMGLARRLRGRSGAASALVPDRAA